MAKALHTIIVVLNLPKPIREHIICVTGIADGIEAHATTFPTPSPSLKQVRKNLDALSAAQAAFQTFMGTVAAREAARKVSVTDAKGLHAYVQGIATANPEQAEIIAAYASMTVRKTPLRHKPDLVVKQLVSESVKLVAKRINGGRAYEWEYSLDGGKTWIRLPTTTRATTVVLGLESGTVVWFRSRAILRKTGQTDWCQPVSHLVG